MMRTRAALTKAASAQIPASDYIPLGTAITPTVITLTGGEYLACWKLEGITFETADRSEVLLRKEALHQFLRSLGGGSFAIWSHKIRRVVTERLQGISPNPFCQHLSDRYYQSFTQHRQMATELYLSLLYRPFPSKVASFFTRMSTRTLAERREQETGQLTILEDMGKQLEASLSRYGPTRLGTYTKQDILYSDQLAFLSYLINGVWEEIPLRRAPLASYLPFSRLHFGDRTGMLEIWHPPEKKFAGFLDMQEYPPFSEPGMNNGLLYSDAEYIETQSFSCLNKRAALKSLATQKGHLIASEDAATREIEQMDQAADDLQSGLIDLGQYHYSLAIFGNTMESVSSSLADARAVFQDGPGFKMARVDVIPECAWFAQIPGNWGLRPREAVITSRNFVCLSPFHNFARGKRVGNPWGEALALFKTPSGQPYYFNFHVSPEDWDSRDEKYPGNTFICGSTGVGKTALELSLLRFATKYQGLRCVVFDKDRGAETSPARARKRSRVEQPMGMATYIEQSVNNALDHYVVTSTDAVIGVFTPVALTAVTLYVLWTGFQVMRGDVQEPVTAVVWRWFRVALITGLTLNGPQYRSLVKEGLDGIQEAFASAFGGVLSMGGTIDQMADPFTTLMETLFTEASSGLVPQFSLFIAGGICATASILMAFVAMGLFLVAKVSLALLLSVGPAFIFCGMFPVTQRYAENWLSSSLVAVFTNVLIMGVITFLASLLRNACLHVLQAYSTTSILADVVGLLFLSITAAYVLLHVASLGASLAGGLSLGNPGGDATRSGMLLVHSVTSGLNRLVPLAMASTGGSLSGPRTGAVRLLSALPAAKTQPGSDLYQRASMERLRNSVSRKE